MILSQQKKNVESQIPNLFQSMLSLKNDIILTKCDAMKEVV